MMVIDYGYWHSKTVLFFLSWVHGADEAPTVWSFDVLPVSACLCIRSSSFLAGPFIAGTITCPPIFLNHLFCKPHVPRRSALSTPAQHPPPPQWARYRALLAPST